MGLNKFIDGEMRNKINKTAGLKNQKKLDRRNSKLKQLSKGFIAIELFLLIIYFVLILGFVSAQNENTKENAELSLSNITKLMQEMNLSGFNVLRINDILKDTRQIYDVQIILKTKGRKTDFSRVFQYEEEVSRLKELAFQAKDELFSLEKSLEKLKEQGIDVSEGEKIIQEVKQRINNEEYEKAVELAESAREKIAEIESSSTGLKIFYRATKRTLLDLLKENYIGILSGVFILVLMYVLFRKRIMRFLIKRKIKKLELRKSNLKKLIQETQKQYFQDGAISEGIYNIRVKKFAELTRDIERQVPLLEEELAKLKEVGDKKNKE